MSGSKSNPYTFPFKGSLRREKEVSHINKVQDSSNLLVMVPKQMEWKLESSACCTDMKMPSASSKPRILAVNLTERPVCKIVPSRPQPRCFLLPVGLELWVYVHKMRNLQKKRYGRAQACAVGRNWDCNLSLSLFNVFPFLCQCQDGQVGSLEQHVSLFCLNLLSGLFLCTTELWPLEAVVCVVF